MGGPKKDKPLDPEIIFDFNARDPQGDEEKNISKQISESLADSDGLLDTLKGYTGCD